MALRLKQNFKKGAAAIEESATSKGGGKRKPTAFVPFFRLKDGEECFAQFTTPIEEVQEILVHRFVTYPKSVTKEVNGKKITTVEEWTENFVCRKAFDGVEDCVLCDEMGHEPDRQYAGIVVLLDPVYNTEAKTKRVDDIEQFKVRGRTWTNQDGNEIFFPDWQFVFQASKNFWRHLVIIDAKQADVGKTPMNVSRVGGDQTTDYAFIPVKYAEPIDWDKYEIPTFEEVVAHLGSEERYDEFFGDPDKRLKQKQKYKDNKKTTDTTTTADDTAEPDEAPKRGKSRLDKIKAEIASY